MTDMGRSPAARARYRAKLNARHRAELLARAEADAERARAWVAEHLEREGTGPTWSELVTAMGWPRRGRSNRHRAIGMLIARGWLDHDEDVERSLRPGVAPG